ncbi:MAG: cyclic pyranopterin monophosphate synthase MoaC [Pirellula sp.]|nr:cyclic pyranopterin monophosphate synthase MoaC [Pirellula sp.]
MSEISPKDRSSLTHVDECGAARMVDVGAKPETRRTAVARGSILMRPEAAKAVRSNELAKGDCLQIARIAAIQATKLTSQLIPLCHAIAIDGVTAECSWKSDCEMEWIVTVTTTGKTGVEMEALTGASVALLTVYDMCKSIDKAMTITQVYLDSKSGGTKGDYRRSNH